MSLPSGDQEPPQKISTDGSGGGRARTTSPVAGSTKCATMPSLQQKTWISVPSGDQVGNPEFPSRTSCRSSPPAGSTVYVTSAPSDGSPRIKAMRPASPASSIDGSGDAPPDGDAAAVLAA